MVYGAFSEDPKLSTLFGFLFSLEFPLTLALLGDVPPPSVILCLLMYGLGFALLGVISALIGRRLPLK